MADFSSAYFLHITGGTCWRPITEPLLSPENVVTMMTKLALTVLKPDGPARRTLVALQGNDGAPGVMVPRSADLTIGGWRWRAAARCKVGPPGAFVWNNLDASSAALSQQAAPS